PRRRCCATSMNSAAARAIPRSRGSAVRPMRARCYRRSRWRPFPIPASRKPTGCWAMTPEERSLWAVLEARDRAIARGAEQRASLQAEVDRRAEVIRGLTAKLHEEDAFGKMNALLEEKEAVIHEQSRALESYRAAFSVLGWVMVPMNHLVLGVRSVLRRTIGRFGPRLGVLRQYPPRVLRPP